MAEPGDSIQYVLEGEPIPRHKTYPISDKGLCLQVYSQGRPLEKDSICVLVEESNRHELDCESCSSDDEEPFDNLFASYSIPTTTGSYSFLIVCLQATSSKHGYFDLEHKDCCKTYHSCLNKGGCKQRRISDFIRIFQQNERFLGKPKVFVIQTAKIIKSTQGEDIKPENVKDYFPRASDTFVFYTHVVRNEDNINLNGWWVVKEFNREIEKTKKRSKEGMEKKIRDFIGSMSETASLQWPEDPESLAGNFFVTITTNLLDGKRFDKDELPHISSTLIKPLSMKQIVDQIDPQA